MRRGIGLLGALLTWTAGACAAWANDVYPIDPGAGVELGSAWDSELGRSLGEAGVCIEADGEQREALDSRRWALVVLTRAGGRLVLGAHVSVNLESEALVRPRMTDAARRLAQSDEVAFRKLCGTGFVAARTRGGQFFAEIEVEPKEARRALAWLQTQGLLGTWSQPEPFAQALDSLARRHSLLARELPGGDRAAAQPLGLAELSSRAISFPEAVTPATAEPYLVTFEPYAKSARAGLPMAVEPADPGPVAEAVFLWSRGRRFEGRDARAVSRLDY